MPRSKDAPDVISIIETDPRSASLVRIGTGPDTAPTDRNTVRMRRLTTPGGTVVRVAVNFPDLLEDRQLIQSALALYDEVQRCGLSGQWFAMRNWQLDDALLSPAQRRKRKEFAG